MAAALGLAGFSRRLRGWDAEVSAGKIDYGVMRLSNRTADVDSGALRWVLIRWMVVRIFHGVCNQTTHN